MNNLLKKNLSWIYFSIVLLISVFIAYNYGKNSELEKITETFSSVKQIRLQNEKTPLVSRLIGTEIPSALYFNMYTDLYNDVEEVIKKKIKTEPISNISFYFKDLNTGLWFGSNEDLEYVPASLFKLPIAMAYYKDSSTDSGLMNKMYVYTKDIDSKIDTSTGLQKSNLVVGNSYTVSELIKSMLVDSDNGAKNLLTLNINVKTLNTLFDLIQLKGPSQDNYYISPREYSLFLRVLYNGSYLGQERSQEILTVLSETTFDRGLRRAVPQDITLIHKFGSVNIIDKVTGQKQIGFHDCGIIYYPGRPFILCFMTSGNDQVALVNAIEKITEMFISYVQKEQKLNEQ